MAFHSSSSFFFFCKSGTIRSLRKMVSRLKLVPCIAASPHIRVQFEVGEEEEEKKGRVDHSSQTSVLCWPVIRKVALPDRCSQAVVSSVSRRLAFRLMPFRELASHADPGRHQPAREEEE